MTTMSPLSRPFYSDAKTANKVSRWNDWNNDSCDNWRRGGRGQLRELAQCIHRQTTGLYRSCGGERADSVDAHWQRRARTHIARVQLPTATTTRLQRALFHSCCPLNWCRLIGQFLCALIGASRSEFYAESAAAMFCVSLITFSNNNH